jgi:hypothetical protein
VQAEYNRAASAPPAVPHPGIPLDAETAKERLKADSQRRRRQLTRQRTPRSARKSARPARRPPAYHPLTVAVFEFLFNYWTDPQTAKPCALIDRYDWGVDRADGTVLRPTTDRLNIAQSGAAWPQSLTKTPIQGHLSRKPVLSPLTGRPVFGGERIHYTSSRAGGFALVKLDIDAHNGQTDALDVVLYLIHAYFPGAYFERSRNGYHIYPLFRVGRIPRFRFNELLARLAGALTKILADHNYLSTIEVKGEFTTFNSDRTVERRGALGALPSFLNGMKDLDRLKSAPVYLPQAIYAILADEPDDAAYTEVPGVQRRRSGGGPTHDRLTSPDKFDATNAACFDFTLIHNQLPDFDKLLSHYLKVSGHEPSPNDARRVQWAIRRRAQRFDPAKAEGGYQQMLPKLRYCIRAHCPDLVWNGTRVTEEELTIYAYTVTVASLKPSYDPKLKDTVPGVAVTGMGRKLKDAGLVSGTLSSPNKLTACKRLLEHGEIIRCLDRGYIVGRAGHEVYRRPQPLAPQRRRPNQ